MGPPRPASAAQGRRHHGSAFAGSFGHVYWTEPIRLRGVDGEVEIVAPLVHLHPLVSVVGRPVEFDADAVVGVPVVLVVESAADGATCLTLGPWQPVGAFDVAGVPAFEREIGAVTGVGQCLV